MANMDPNLDPNRSYSNRNLDYQPVDRGMGTGGWIAGLLALILVVGAIFWMVNRSDTTSVSSTRPNAPTTTGAAPSPASPPSTTGSSDTSSPMRAPASPPSPSR
jgi:hypothetical protein